MSVRSTLCTCRQSMCPLGAGQGPFREVAFGTCWAAGRGRRINLADCGSRIAVASRRLIWVRCQMKLIQKTTTNRLGLLGTLFTLGVVLALTVVVVSSNTPIHANSSPDLEVGTPTVDNSTTHTGASFTLSATVTNAGDGGSAATTLRYYRSTDATITTSDTEVGTDAVGALAASGTSDQSIDLTAPSTAGTYYYGACVDSVMNETVTGEDNCSLDVRVTVVNTPATGAPTIAGTAQVGQTLTASTTGISDHDGLTNVTYSYQWADQQGC